MEFRSIDGSVSSTLFVNVLYAITNLPTTICNCIRLKSFIIRDNRYWQDLWSHWQGSPCVPHITDLCIVACGKETCFWSQSFHKHSVALAPVWNTKYRTQSHRVCTVLLNLRYLKVPRYVSHFKNILRLGSSFINMNWLRTCPVAGFCEHGN
jgi:hypothetical protein